MNVTKRMGVTALLVGLLGLPALADTAHGTVAQVQSNHFTLISAGSQNNAILRIMLKPGDHFPSTLVAGAKVVCEVHQDSQKQWILDQIEQVEGLVLPKDAPR